MKDDVKAILDSNSNSIETNEDTSPKVIPLRTALKIIPGRKLAIYIGVVITLLMLMYNIRYISISIWNLIEYFA